MITERLDGIVAQYAGSVAVADDEERITYRELASRKAWFARYLRGSLNLAEGDVVAVSLPNCWEFIVSFFAIAEIGAVSMPFNTQWRTKEIEWCASRLPISAVITNQELREPWDHFQKQIPAGRVVVVDEPAMRQELGADRRGEEVMASPARRRFEDEAVLYLATSGSTGRPRVVPRSHRNLVAGVTNIAEALNISPGLRFLSVVPFYHAHGFNNCMFLPLMKGATAVLMRKFIPSKLVEKVRREGIQILIASPFVFRMLAEHSTDARAFSSVEICMSSGAPMSAALTALCADRLGIRVRQLYGSSETATISIESAHDTEGGGSVGRPLKSVEVRILAGDGREQPANQVGEIAVKSAAVMKGYLGEPELNAKVFHDGFFRTGDLGRIDEQNNLVISGRVKQVINVGGIKVDPAEIENVLEALPEVRECRVLGIADPRQTEIIKAVVAVRPGRSLSRRQIVEHCRKYLTDYKIPRVIEFVESIPADITGKYRTAWEVERDDLSGS